MRRPEVVAQRVVGRTRQLSAACGAMALLALSFTQDQDLNARLALSALMALGVATALGSLQLLLAHRRDLPEPDRMANRGSGAWSLVTIGVVVTTGLSIQSWFRSGTSIAQGDIVPPDGFAWVARVFEPWTWNGYNLGGPSQLPLQLPWAALLSTVRFVGGDPELAQRIWYTSLFVGAALGVLGLLAALRFGPTAAAVGTVIYILNPYVVSVVNINPVYIAALGLLAALPAAVIGVGTGQLSVRRGAALVALAAPVLGYVALNPPLVGMVLGALLAAPLVAGWVDGKAAGFRSLRALVVGVSLLLVASLYWIVPMVLYLPGVASDQLASLSSWTWTEGRATITNAFWLNTTWGWVYPAYYPFAATYDVPPVSLVRFILPAIAFGALALGWSSGGDQRSQPYRHLRMAVIAAAFALFLVFVSTGTNPPGNIIFEHLYRLPLGWLLREPGRFLMVVALAYAVLVAIVVEISRKHQRAFQIWRLPHVSLGLFRFALVPAVLGTSLLTGFPLYTGAVVPDTRPTLPPAHVRVPGYWTEMAQFADRLSTPGALLVLPPDDFYQMPYDWGYVGADAEFVVSLFHRPVLVPNGQGYSPASEQILATVNLTAHSILVRDWQQVEALTTALNTPLILVRRDIVAPYAGRSIVLPDDLAAALSAAPNFTLVRTIGSLELFELTTATTDSERISAFMTVNTSTPDLRLLSLLPAGAALVSSEAQAGIPSVVEAPALELWQDSGNSLVWQTPAPHGSSYRVADVASKTIVSLDRPGIYTAGPSQARVTYGPNGVDGSVTVSVPTRTIVSNGDFANGPWGPIGDCHAVQREKAKPTLDATVVPNGAPGGLPALRLSAGFDSACDSQRLDWHGGPLVLSLMVRSVQGLPPRVCLFEFGPQHCASLPGLPSSSGWSLYRTAVSPDPETTALDILVYAEADHVQTVSEYAQVRVLEVPALASFTLLVKPEGEPRSPIELVVVHDSFSLQWGSTYGKHVLVDAMLNGWLVQSGSRQSAVAYMPATTLRAAQWLSLVTWLVAFLIAVIPVIRRVARRPPSRAADQP